MFLDVLAWIIAILLPILVLYIFGTAMDDNDGKVFTTRAATPRVILERIMYGIIGLICIIISLAIIIGGIVLVGWAYSKVGLF